MPIRLAAYTVVGSVLTYSLEDVVERDRLMGSVPPFATVVGSVVTVDLAVPQPELGVLA